MLVEEIKSPAMLADNVPKTNINATACMLSSASPAVLWQKEVFSEKNLKIKLATFLYNVYPHLLCVSSLFRHCSWIQGRVYRKKQSMLISPNATTQKKSS